MFLWSLRQRMNELLMRHIVNSFLIARKQTLPGIRCARQSGREADAKRPRTQRPAEAHRGPLRPVEVRTA